MAEENNGSAKGVRELPSLFNLFECARRNEVLQPLMSAGALHDVLLTRSENLPDMPGVTDQHRAAYRAAYGAALLKTKTFKVEV